MAPIARLITSPLFVKCLLHFFPPHNLSNSSESNVISGFLNSDLVDKVLRLPIEDQHVLFLAKQLDYLVKPLSTEPSRNDDKNALLFVLAIAKQHLNITKNDHHKFLYESFNQSLENKNLIPDLTRTSNYENKIEKAIKTKDFALTYYLAVTYVSNEKNEAALDTKTIESLIDQKWLSIALILITKSIEYSRLKFSNDSLLTKACENDLGSMVPLLLQRNYELFEQLKALNIALVKKDEGLISLLTDSINAAARSTLLAGTTDIGKQMAIPEATKALSAYRNSILSSAVENGLFEIVEYLTSNQKKINISDEECCAFLRQVAAQEDGDQKVKYLLSKGVNINVTGSHGDTPLLRTVIYDDAKSIKVLLENGADITATTNDTEAKEIGQNALHIAISNYNSAHRDPKEKEVALENFAVLINHIETLNETDRKKVLTEATANGCNDTPLRVALRTKSPLNPDMIQKLIELDPNINKDMDVVLGIIKQYNHEEIIPLLRARNPNLTIKDNDGITPDDLKNRIKSEDAERKEKPLTVSNNRPHSQPVNTDIYDKADELKGRTKNPEISSDQPLPYKTLALGTALFLPVLGIQVYNLVDRFQSSPTLVNTAKICALALPVIGCGLMIKLILDSHYKQPNRQNEL